ncbi:PqqD family peptide modification chaperone [Zoogloea sp.]|uniref:radical SAM protein n=1 Tax=Zoogloea sp. TaxID=49181 RepID=UPI0035B2CAF1
MDDDLNIIRRQYRYRDDLSLLFDYKSGRYHRLDNESARLIVRWAMAGATFSSILDRLMHTFEIDFELAARDASDFIRQLSVLDHSSNDAEWFGVDKGFSEPNIRFPLRVEFELTALCNYKCGFCYNVWKIDPNLSDREVREHVKGFPEKHLNMKLIERLLRECSINGAHSIRYSGGETTLYPQLLDVLDIGCQERLYQTIFTNGHLISEDRARMWEERNVRCVLISLHGPKEVHDRLVGYPGSYERVKRSAQILRSYGIEVVIEYALVHANASLVRETLDDVVSWNVTEFRVMRYVPTGKHDDKYGVPLDGTFQTIQSLDDVLQASASKVRVGWPCGQKICTSETDKPLMKDDPTMPARLRQLTGSCESGLTWCSVSFDGKLRNCPHSNVFFGDLNNESIAQVWARLNREVSRILEPREGCSSCSVLGQCKGGCHLPKLIRPAAQGVPLASISRAR